MSSTPATHQVGVSWQVYSTEQDADQWSKSGNGTFIGVIAGTIGNALSYGSSSWKSDLCVADTGAANLCRHYTCSLSRVLKIDLFAGVWFGIRLWIWVCYYVHDYCLKSCQNSQTDLGGFEMKTVYATVILSLFSAVVGVFSVTELCAKSGVRSSSIDMMSISTSDARPARQKIQQWVNR